MKCKRCRKWLPYIGRGRPRKFCDRCYYKKSLAQARRYREKNRARIRLKAKLFAREHPELVKEWSRKHWRLYNIVKKRTQDAIYDDILKNTRKWLDAVKKG